jgi:spermidine synthase
MKLDKQKTLLSYLYDISIQPFFSEKNGEMHLYLSSGEYKLVSKNAIYSFGNKYISFGSAFEKLKISEYSNIQKVLVLGWGMGSIANLLIKHPYVKTIHGVEHDKDLVDFYNQRFRNQYNFGFEVQVETADAFAFFDHHTTKYDLICSDIFNDNTSPTAVISIEYLSQLNKSININGIVMLSKLNRSSEDVAQNQTLEQNLTKLNIHFNCIRTVGNNIYWWQKAG